MKAFSEKLQQDASLFFEKNLGTKDASNEFKEALRSKVQNKYINYYEKRKMNFIQKIFALNGLTAFTTILMGLSLVGIVSGGAYLYKEKKDSEKTAVAIDQKKDFDESNKVVSYTKSQEKNQPVVKETKTETKQQTAPAPTPTPVPAPVAGSIALSGSADANGINLHWDVSNLDVSSGFKIVKGSNPNPTYGVDGAIYVDANQRDYSIGVKNGATYHFRVCRYTGSGCDTYSNNVTVTAPTAPASVVNSITLVSGGGTLVSWTVDGSASNGFKLVFSTNPSPTYPPSNGGGAAYYEANKFSGDLAWSVTDPGTYYVRVCEYKSNGTCGVYSNEITVVKP